MIRKVLKKVYNHMPSKIKNKIYDRHKSKQLRPLVNKNKFINKINRYDVISFDIFDTLITRKIYNPDDIFKMIGEKYKIDNFLEKRKNAERLAIEKYKHDVNIDEIYECYKDLNKLSAKSVKEIEKAEKNLEIGFIIPRKEMLEVFNELIKNNKTVILTSDMYLDKDTIEKMLKKCGYVGYKHFFLSNDVKKRKDTGEIWDVVKKEYDGKIIHIGDNDYSDVTLPKSHGIDTYKIYSGRELFARTEVFNFIKDKLNSLNTNESIFYGLMVNKNIYNSPFSSIELDDIEKVGYLLFGPLMNDFMDYISEETKKDDILLFLSREGYYLQKLYKDYSKINNKKEIKNEYFLVSRKATKSTLLDDKKELDSLLDDYFKGNISSFFKQIIGIKYKGEDFEIELPNDKEKVLKILNDYKDDIIKNAKNDKKNYIEYINRVIDSKDYKKAYLVDLGYSGSIQLNVSKMLDFDFKGLYLLSSEKIKKYKKDSVLKFRYNSIDDNMFLNIYHSSLLIEYFLSAPFGQLLSFDNDGHPIYNDESLSDEKREILNKLYDCSVEYFEDVKEIRDIIEFNPEKWDIAFMFNATIDTNYISRKVKDLFEFYDDHSFSEKYNIFKRISKY